MSASNSISQLLEQFLELNTNALETFNRINEAITTNKETVVIDLFNNSTNQMETIQIPAFGYLKREIERLNNNINSISGLEGSDATVRLKDGSYRTIHTARLKGPSKSITSLASPTMFGTKLNEFFEDFLNPLLTINLDVTGQIPVETEKVYVERFVFDSNDAATITAFDEIYKGGSEIDYATFKAQLNDNPYKYYVDAEVLDMPMRLIQYNGTLDVTKIDNVEKSQVIDGVTQTRTVKLYTVNKLAYSDSTKDLKDTETLKVGDSLIVNSGNYRTRYQIVSIDNSTSQLELLLMEGSEAIKIGVNQLGVYKDVDTNLDVEIKIGFNERQVIFIKPIDPNSKIPAENYSPGVAFYSNELEIVNALGNKMTLAEYYRDEVSDFGQFIKSLKVDYIPPASVGIKPNVPLIDTTNFKVVQINKHLTNNTTTDKIKQLKADKTSVEQEIKKLDEAIKQKKSLINTKKFKSSAEKDTQNNELNSLINQRESSSKLFSSIITDIKSSAESADLQTVAPKFRVRGFWSVPEPKKIGNQVSQEVVQFKIRYRYVSTSGKTSEVDQIKFTDSVNQTEKTAAFSNWVEVMGPVRKRQLGEDGKYAWVLESEEDANAINFNSLDISINPGEIVEVMVKSISEAGFPANPVESEWSEIQRIEFPQGEVNTDVIDSVVKANELDAVRVQIQQDLETAGVYSHVAETFTAGESMYAHNASSIASGFLSDLNNPLSVYDKLLSLQNEVLRLRAVIEGTVGELMVKIIDEDGNVTPVTNNSTVQLFAGYYVNEIPSTGGKGYIVTKNFKVELSNTKATDLELIARIIGDTRTPAHVSTVDTRFGLGTGAPSPEYVNDDFYKNEGRYDLVPVVYQNIDNVTGLNTDYFNSGPEQSTQLRGQFIYSRFKNLAADDNLYIIDERNSNGGFDGDIDIASVNGYDKYEYGLNFVINGITVNPDGSKNFTGATATPLSTENNPGNFIWAGTYIGSVPNKTGLGGAVTYSDYSNGIYMHTDHPLLSGYSSVASPSSAILEIVGNGLVGMPKTAPRRADDAHGKKQTPFRIIKTLNKQGSRGLRSTIKNGFNPEDQYLLGGRSCGSFLYLSPLNVDSLVVDAPNKNGKKIVVGGSANAITIDLVFQYRMTDYFGEGAAGTGRVGGVIDNTLTNLTYSKKIGLDILDFAKKEFKFDIEVYAKYSPQGKNINNITSSMLSNYNTNFQTGGGGGGRRLYLAEDRIDYSYPEINMY
jgi:hypothetical protein